MSIENAYMMEKDAIAATVFNRMDYVADNLSSGGFSQHGATIVGVIGARGRYEGMYDKKGNVHVSNKNQNRLNNALNSPCDSHSCADLLLAICVANQWIGQRLGSVWIDYGNVRQLGNAARWLGTVHTNSWFWKYFLLHSKMIRQLKIVLILTVLFFHGVRLSGVDSAAESLPVWIANAVQWDAVWGRDEVTCASGKFSLSSQLQSSGSHTFGMEMARYQDCVEALLPELHRLVSIRLTPDQRLASITIETTCESGLQSYRTKLKSLPQGRPVEDPRLQEHLQELNQRAQRQNPQEVSSQVGTIEITVPAQRPLPSLKEWEKAKIDALKSIEDAAQASFQQECAKGESATAEVPNFELYDPALLLVVRAKDGSCVLPIGFEWRQSSADP